MTWRLVAVLSALWCVLVIAPATVATSLFKISIHSSIGGPVFGVWIVGFLLQIAVFFVIGRKSPRDPMLGWFLASIMPFAADWSAAASWWALVICAAIVAGYAASLTWSVYGYDRLIRDGERATGVVVGVKQPLFNDVINNAYIRRTLRLRIERRNGAAPYEASLKGTFMLGEIPAPGARLSVLIDPLRPQHVEIASKKPTSKTDGPQATRRTARPHTLAPDISEQLADLTSMHRRGDLTDAEFTAAKKRLLGT
jgi:Short C-terminal domain